MTSIPQAHTHASGHTQESGALSVHSINGGNPHPSGNPKRGIYKWGMGLGSLVCTGLIGWILFSKHGGDQDKLVSITTITACLGLCSWLTLRDKKGGWIMMQGTLFGILAAAVWTWIAGSGGLNIALAVTTFHLLIINTVHIIQHRGEMHHTPLWVMIILAGAASASTWTLTQNYGGEIKEKLQENFGRVLPAWDTTAQPNPNPNPNHNPQTVRVTEPDVATHPKNDAKTDTKGDDNTHAIKPHRTLWETLQMSIPALKKTPFHRVNPHEEIQITRRDEPGVIRVRRKTYFQKIGLDLPPGRYKTEKGGYIYILP